MTARTLRLLMCALLPVALAGSARGEARSEQDTAALFTAVGAYLEWTPLVEAEAIVLALADPSGEVRTVSFGPGEAPVLSLVDTEGQPLPDGGYMWELRIARARSPELRRVMEAAERRGDIQQLARLARLNAPLRQSGYFTVENGLISSPITSEENEDEITQASSRFREATVADAQVVPDHLIVDGRSCIGLGCSNGEEFFSEALRLKQKVVRLRFEDTSSAGFPSRDWQLLINDSGAGQSETFSIQDITENTLPLTILGGSGNVGLGATLPAKDLHVADAIQPTIRLEQTSGSLQSWDLSATGANLEVTNASNGRVSLKLLSKPTHEPLLPALEVVRTSHDGASHLENMLRLTNHGGVMFLLDRTDSPQGVPAKDWQFSNFNTVFQISIPGTPRGQFSLHHNGRLELGGTGHDSSPHFLLTEAGNLTVQGTMTASHFIDTAPPNPDWPDYVFSPGYELMPLPELGSYIQENHHLPKVPTAEQIAASGLDLGQFQVLLLEKIEELTLHVIAQDEAIRDLQAKLRAASERDEGTVSTIAESSRR